MTQLDFSTITTDDLLQVIPSTETKEWEFKAASAFDPKQFGDFKKHKLGRIVSSFANSGGGYLLLGKRDDADVFEPILMHEGRTKMEDHLSLLISQSVVPHYRNFEIHRVPISGRTGESVLVVRFDDSPMAPHQSLADTNYFYRLPGHCVPAPHFYIELVRGRYTKAVVVIEPPSFSVSIPYTGYDMKFPNELRLHVAGVFTVRNASLSQIAQPCAVRVFNADAPTDWKVKCDRTVPLNEGILVKSASEELFPTLSKVFNIEFEILVPRKSRPNWMDFLPAWLNLAFSVQPFSQNFAGDVSLFRPSEYMCHFQPTETEIYRNAEELLSRSLQDRLNQEGALKASMAKNVEQLAQITIPQFPRGY